MGFEVTWSEAALAGMGLSLPASQFCDYSLAPCLQRACLDLSWYQGVR